MRGTDQIWQAIIMKERDDFQKKKQELYSRIQKKRRPFFI